MSNLCEHKENTSCGKTFSGTHFLLFYGEFFQRKTLSQSQNSVEYFLFWRSMIEAFQFCLEKKVRRKISFFFYPWPWWLACASETVACLFSFLSLSLLWWGFHCSLGCYVEQEMVFFFVPQFFILHLFREMKISVYAMIMCF